MHFSFKILIFLLFVLKAIVGGLDPRSISRLEQSLKYIDILLVEWSKEFKLMINFSDLNYKDSKNLNTLSKNKDDFNDIYINNFKSKDNSNANMPTNNNYNDDYSISIPYACHELFSVLVPFIRFPEYIDKIIAIIYKLIPYLSFYIELVINLSTTNDKYLLFENTVLYYVSLILEIIGYYSEGDEYYINQWNELLNIELNYEYNSLDGTNMSRFNYCNSTNTNINNENKIEGIEYENKLEQKAMFSNIIFNREILIKLILDLLCNFINIKNHDAYSTIFWNAISYIINIPSSHGIPSTLVYKLFNSNNIQDNELNLLIHFINRPQVWVKKHILFELMQIEKNKSIVDSLKFNNFHSVLAKNFDILIFIINYGLQDSDMQVRQLTKLFLKYFINSDSGSQNLYNLILWLQIYNDDDIHSLALVAFDKIKNKCNFNKRMLLWLRMLYYKDEKIRKKGFSIIDELFTDIKELSNNIPQPWNIYYFKNTDIDILEKELEELDNVVFKKINVTDTILKTQILKTKALLKDESSLKKNMEELLNIMINIQNVNIKMKEDSVKEISIFIVDVVVDYSDVLFNNELIAKIFLKIILLVLKCQNNKSLFLSKNFDIDINSQFLKNLIILSFHPKQSICYLIAKSLSYILFKPDDYQLYSKDRNIISNDELNDMINVNNNLLPVQVVNSYNNYNENIKSVNIFNYRNNEDLNCQSLQKIWEILIGMRHIIIENIYLF